MLIAERLCRTAPGQQSVLSNVELTVRPGGITVVIGPSGGGKTTLLRALALIEPPTLGRITLDGEVTFDSEKRVLAPLWPTVTVVFQQLFLWPHLTLRQNIFLPFELRRTTHTRESVNELIQELSLSEAADRHPNETSLGQRQRAALIRAIALSPRYLLLDEITSALDTEQVERVGQVLKRQKQRGVGILLTTHLLGFARDLADEVMLLDKGEIIERGAADFFTSPSHPRTQQFLAVAGGRS